MNFRRAWVFLVLGFLLFLGCSQASHEPSNEIPPQPSKDLRSKPPANFFGFQGSQDPKENINSYAEKIGVDPAAIEKTFTETLGSSPPDKLNEAWIAFFKTTDPALYGIEAILSQNWAKLLKTTRINAPVPQANSQ